MWFILRLNSPILIGKRGTLKLIFAFLYQGAGKADLIRLNELERKGKKMFKDGVVGQYDGSWYRYSSETIGIEEDKELCCYYVNVKLLFEVLNVN